MRARLPLLLLCLSCLPAAHADPEGDRMLQEALLRQYTTSEAEARYEAHRRNPDAATQALGNGMSNLVSRMYQRSQARVAAAAAEKETWDAYWFAVVDGKDLVVANDRDRRILIEMLETNSKKGYWQATQRLVEYALHLRPGSEQVFPQPQDAQAAYLLRRKVYGMDGRELWAVNLLGKLYLTGHGVQRDEEEALRLFRLCAAGEANGGLSGKEDLLTINTQCALNAARMIEKGWGVDPDPAEAARLRATALSIYNSQKQTKYDVAALEEAIRP